MANQNAATKPIHMLLEQDLLEQIENFRYSNRYPTRVETIKALIKRGLQHPRSARPQKDKRRGE
jgi:metal-responsive CopG/Arc/MetJ family transcriptional regulator